MLLGNSLCLFVQGLDLRVYSKQIEESLRSVERQSVGDYIKESSNMAKLHTRIQVSRQIYIRTTQARKHGTSASHRTPRLTPSLRSIINTRMQACDGILETMEDMLGQFQSDLGNISGEIQTLQEQSLSMNVKLKNRKAVQAGDNSVNAPPLPLFTAADSMCSSSPSGPSLAATKHPARFMLTCLLHQ